MAKVGQTMIAAAVYYWIVTLQQIMRSVLNIAISMTAITTAMKVAFTGFTYFQQQLDDLLYGKR